MTSVKPNQPINYNEKPVLAQAGEKQSVACRNFYTDLLNTYTSLTNSITSATLSIADLTQSSANLTSERTRLIAELEQKPTDTRRREINERLETIRITLNRNDEIQKALETSSGELDGYRSQLTGNTFTLFSNECPGFRNPRDIGR